MNIINLQTQQSRYQKIFKKLHSEDCLLVSWQVDPESGTRKIADSRLIEFQSNLSNAKFSFTASDLPDHDLPIYFYAEIFQLIFKTTILNSNAYSVSVRIPDEIHLLDEKEVKTLESQPGLSTYWKSKRLVTPSDNPDHLGSDYVIIKSMAQRTSRDQKFLENEFDMPSLDEEDLMFADKRESPRAKPTAEKWVKIQKVGTEGIDLFILYDLSRGGISFIVIGEEDYPKGTKVNIMGFEKFDLDDPLVGKIMSLRPTDEYKVEFKVGVKFDEGQS